MTRSRPSFSGSLRRSAWNCVGAICGSFFAGVTSSAMAFQLKAPGLRIWAGCHSSGAKQSLPSPPVPLVEIYMSNAIFGSKQLLPSLRSASIRRLAIGDPCFVFGWCPHLVDSEHRDRKSHSVRGSRIYVSDHIHGIYRRTPSNQRKRLRIRLLEAGTGCDRRECVDWRQCSYYWPVTIGRGAIVGANSVVRGEVPPNTIVSGAPAKPSRFLIQAGCG